MYSDFLDEQISKYPKSVFTAMKYNPGAYVTNRGVELVRPNGSIELLVSFWELLDKYGEPDDLVRDTIDLTSDTNKKIIGDVVTSELDKELLQKLNEITIDEMASSIKDSINIPNEVVDEIKSAPNQDRVLVAEYTTDLNSLDPVEQQMADKAVSEIAKVEASAKKPRKSKIK